MPSKASRSATAPRLVGAAVLTAGALVVRELARPRPHEKAHFVDWDAVRRRAYRGTDETAPTHLVFSAEKLGHRYDGVLDELRPWIAEAVDEPIDALAFPRFTVVDRHGWIDVNLELFKTLVDPVIKLQEMVPASMLTDIGRAGISGYMGILLGFLSKRVLGQYDPVLMAPAAPAPTALYLVEPNIEAWETRAEISGEQLRQWLVLHEVTHAWEFEAHPWLRDHINSLIRDLIAHRLFAQPNPGRWEVLRALTIGARSQWQAMSQAQAVMSLLEGFSNVIMRRVGQAHLPNFEAIDEEFNRRSERRGLAERAFFKVTGLEMKMLQYVQGERFCDEVIAAGGMARLAQVWTGPESLPSLQEVREPSLWLARTA